VLEFRASISNHSGGGGSRRRVHEPIFRILEIAKGKRDPVMGDSIKKLPERSGGAESQEILLNPKGGERGRQGRNDGWNTKGEL